MNCPSQRQVPLCLSCQCNSCTREGKHPALKPLDIDSNESISRHQGDVGKNDFESVERAETLTSKGPGFKSGASVNLSDSASLFTK